jgi:hypothetical protein
LQQAEHLATRIGLLLHFSFERSTFLLKLTAAAMNALVSGIAASGWHDYFETINAAGPGVDLNGQRQRRLWPQGRSCTNIPNGSPHGGRPNRNNNEI